ncbi:MAG: DUF1186 family protein [Treponema sp.]|nr:DUF1186 family protein [Treponema sp.]
MLCSAYNGNISLLQEVIENDACYEFARSAAVKAYAYIVRDEIPEEQYAMLESVSKTLGRMGA